LKEAARKQQDFLESQAVTEEAGHKRGVVIPFQQVQEAL